MFFAYLGLPAGSLRATARTFAEALGNIIFGLAKEVAQQEGLSFAEQVSFRQRTFTQIHRQLPPSEPGVDTGEALLALMSRYERPLASSKAEWNQFVASYTADLERAFQHQHAKDVRRAGALVFDVFLSQMVARTLQALEGASA